MTRVVLFQASRAGLQGTFRAFLSSELGSLESIVRYVAEAAHCCEDVEAVFRLYIAELLLIDRCQVCGGKLPKPQ